MVQKSSVFFGCTLFFSSLLVFPGLLRAEEARSGELWVTAGVSVALVGSAFLGDRAVRDYAREHQNSRADHILTSAEMMGQWQSAIPVGALYAGGLLFGNEKAQDAAVSSCMASAIGAGLVTQTLKYSLGRARPRQNEGVRNFRPFSGDVSFPSGHTAQAFSVVSAIAETYQDLRLSVPLYAVAMMTGAARIYHDAHFLSDVTAGAVIGTLAGVYSAGYIRDRKKGAGISFAPYLDGGISGLIVSGGF